MLYRAATMLVLVLALTAFARTGIADTVPPTEPQAPGQEDTGPGTLACRGNEPFWNLTIDGTEAEYARLTDAAPPRPQRLRGTLQARAFFTPPLFVWRGRGERASGDLVAMITGERCLDTMSDSEGQTSFDYTVRISTPSGELLTGCCNAGARSGRAP